MTQKKGKIFNDPSCSSQTLEGLLREGFHSTANKPTLHLPSVSEKHTHYSEASFILLEHNQPPPHFRSQQTALVRTWTFCGPDSEDLCDLGHVIYFFSFPTSIPKWKRLWAQFRSKAIWRLRAKRDKPCEFRISSLERPHQETGTESQLSTRALLFPPKGITPVPAAADGRAPTLAPGPAQLQPHLPGTPPQHIRHLARPPGTREADLTLPLRPHPQRTSWRCRAGPGKQHLQTSFT